MDRASANRFISLYQLRGEAQQVKNAELELSFSISRQGLISMDRARLVKSDESKRRKTNDPGTENTATDIEKDLINNSQELTFTVTSLGGLPDNLISRLREQEKEMIEDDLREVSRQEAKNLLEETLYKVRSEVLESCEGLEAEEAVTNIKTYFDQIETWLYEEGEDVPEQSYRESLKQLEERVKVFYMWRSKLMEMRAREQERRVPSRSSPGGVLESEGVLHVEVQVDGDE